MLEPTSHCHAPTTLLPMRAHTFDAAPARAMARLFIIERCPHMFCWLPLRYCRRRVTLRLAIDVDIILFANIH